MLKNKALITVYGEYRSGARRRKIPFEISMDDLRDIAIQNCVYCFSEPKSKRITRGCVFVYSGVDRLDSSKGYNKENCVPCCKMCNRIKSNFSMQDFLDHVDRIYKNRKETGLP